MFLDHYDEREGWFRAKALSGKLVPMIMTLEYDIYLL
jgi:hypothetical protein